MRLVRSRHSGDKLSVPCYVGLVVGRLPVRIGGRTRYAGERVIRLGVGRRQYDLVFGKALDVGGWGYSVSFGFEPGKPTRAVRGERRGSD